MCPPFPRPLHLFRQRARLWDENEGLELVRVVDFDARALDAADPPMRDTHRALGAPVRFTHQGEKGRYEGDERDHDLQPAHELVGHVG